MLWSPEWCLGMGSEPSSGSQCRPALSIQRTSRNAFQLIIITELHNDNAFQLIIICIITQLLFSPHCKKVYKFSRPQLESHWPDSTLDGYNYIIPVQEEFVSDFPARKIYNLFLQCSHSFGAVNIFGQNLLERLRDDWNTKTMTNILSVSEICSIFSTYKIFTTLHTVCRITAYM